MNNIVRRLARSLDVAMYNLAMGEDMIVWLVIVFAAFSIGLGCTYIFAKDSVWNWTKLRNQMSGQVSQRTREWEATKTLLGIFMLCVGLSVTAFTATAFYKDYQKRPNLPPRVIAQYEFGDLTAKDTIILSANGSYKQIYRNRNGKTYTNKGQWSEFGGRYLLEGTRNYMRTEDDTIKFETHNLMVDKKD